MQYGFEDKYVHCYGLVRAIGHERGTGKDMQL